MKKETEKESKYKNFAVDMQRMCSVKTKAVPVKVGATGTISIVHEVPERTCKAGHNIA